MRLSHVLPTLLGLASLASLASASGTVVESRTVCHTSYGALRTTYYSTSSTSTTCPVSTVTKTKSGSQAVKTSTVLQTVTVAALPTTVTVTSTVDTTSALTTTSVTTSTTGVTATATTTSYSFVGGPSPNKRDVQRHTTTSQPQVHCTVLEYHCTPSVTTTTTTVARGGKGSLTVTVTSQKIITTTPTVKAKHTVTSTSATTSVVTSTSISTTTTTTTTTSTTTFSNFNIAASSDTTVADGTTLDNSQIGGSGAGYAVFDNANTVFTLDSSTGQLYDISTQEIAVIALDGPGANSIYFLTSDNISGNPYEECDCEITGTVLFCNCYGETAFQTDPEGGLYVASSVDDGYNSVTLVVLPVS